MGNYFFYPPEIKQAWDSIEISQVYENKTEKYCERIDGEETLQEALSAGHEVFWSLYLHQIEGGVYCIADLPTEEQAIELKTLLELSAKSYKS